VVGKVPDPAPYLALADLFLESYPTRAGTTPLEAAMVGLPVVALADLPEDDPARAFQTSSPGLAGISVATTAEKCAVAVRRLASDAELRRREGAKVQATVSAVHDGPGWRSALEALYERARSLPPRDVDDLGERPVSDERYAAMLLSAVSPGLTSPDPRRFVQPLGDLYDARMHGDLFALLHRDAGSSLTVRVAAGWERHLEWTTRLLELAGTYPRLRVSLPFAAHDDVQGTQTSAFLTTALDRIGQSPETCGDIRVEVARRLDAGTSIDEELPFLPEALDRLQALLASPLWEGSRELAAAGAPTG
jgi:hypothetical protein